MSYVDPKDVKSPKNKVSDLCVIYDGGEAQWALAQMKWGDDLIIGLRWNGTSKEPIGNPQSHGIPTWFILPDEIANIIYPVFKLNLLKHGSPKEI